MVGEKIKDRLREVPTNIKAAADDVRTESVATAVSNVPQRFGKSNRRLLK